MANKRSRPPAAESIQLAAPAPLSLADELFRRRKLQTIFISSEMGSGALLRTRRVAAEAVRRTRIAEPWLWEESVHAGPYISEETCVTQAANSQGLVLIIDRVITPITRKEYRAARANGVPVYVMAMARRSRPPEIERFLKRERKHVIYKEPRNHSELATHVEEAIIYYTNEAVWRRQDELRRSAIEAAKKTTRTRKS